MSKQILWEHSAQIAYNDLESHVQEVFRHWIAMTEMDRTVSGINVLSLKAGEKLVCIDSGHVLVYIERSRSHWLKSQNVITIKHIAENIRMLPHQYFLCIRKSDINGPSVQDKSLQDRRGGSFIS